MPTQRSAWNLAVIPSDHFLVIVPEIFKKIAIEQFSDTFEQLADIVQSINE